MIRWKYKSCASFSNLCSSANTQQIIAPLLPVLAFFLVQQPTANGLLFAFAAQIRDATYPGNFSLCICILSNYKPIPLPVKLHKTHSSPKSVTPQIPMSHYNNPHNDITGLTVESKTTTKHWMQRIAIGNRGVTNTVVSVIDSFSQNKIEVPVRGRHCLHLQPFDAESFIKRPLRLRTCPVCNEKVRREELMKMEYFQQIFDHLKKFHPRVERIAIQTDGTWHKIEPSASNHSNHGYESGRQWDNPRNLNHIGSNNGNTVISMNNSNRSTHSIFGSIVSIRNRVKSNNVVTVDVWKMMDQELFIALNEIRTNPKYLIPDIEHVLKHIKDGVYYAPSKQRTGVRVGQMLYEKR